MVSKNDNADFYKGLEEQLVDSQQWPGPYLFKFIVKSDSSHIETIRFFFQTMDANFTVKHSSKKNFVSLSAKVLMESPKAVIVIYRKMGQLDGVMAL